MTRPCMVQEQPQSWFQIWLNAVKAAVWGASLHLLVFLDGLNTSPVADPDVPEGSPSAELPLHTHTKAGAGSTDLLNKPEPYWQAQSAQQLKPSSLRAGLRSTRLPQL